MIVRNFVIKFLIFLMTALLISSCANTQKQPPRVESDFKSNASVIAVTPTPFLGQKAKIQGENSPIKFAGNFENSIKQQEQPNIWLEFKKETGETLKTELGDRIKQNLKADWNISLLYRYVKDKQENPNEKAQATYDFDTTFINARNEIMTLEIDSPDGKRNLTEDEIEEIFSVQIKLMADRYEKLNKHFNPKT